MAIFAEIPPTLASGEVHHHLDQVRINSSMGEIALDYMVPSPKFIYLKVIYRLCEIPKPDKAKESPDDGENQPAERNGCYSKADDRHYQ